jgi:N-acyl-D-aspartate/D-glutamate deacylase
MNWLARIVVAFLLLTALQSVSRADDKPVDVLIRNGRIVDGTGNPWFHGDVAIRGDRIVAVGPRLRFRTDKVKTVIDAKGLIVAPGFIDIHSHSDFLLLEDGHAQSKIRQGVTTEILGEGNSAGPAKGKLGPRVVKIAKQSVPIRTLGDYFKAIETKRTAVNVASYVGLSTIWRCVMGDSFARPTEADFKQMEVLVDEAMRDGALGLSSQVMMPPGSLAKTEDIIRLCKVVKKYGGLYSTHIRNEGLGVMESVTEAIRIGEEAGVPVDVIHIKIADQQLWGNMPKVVALIEAARRRGVNVQANVYPYTRGNNNLASIIPPWAHEGGTRRMLARLKDPKLRDRLKRDINGGIKDWYNHYTAVGKDWSRMLVSANNSYRGLTMDRVFKLRNNGKLPADPLDEFFKILIENNGSVSTVYAHHTEQDMVIALSQPWCSVGSDGSAYAVTGPLRRGNPHPRNFGTFPRVLGVYVREQKLLTLEDAVRKMTSLNASKVGLKTRGLLHPGFFADVTIFNPATIRDRSTYTEPFQYPTGVEYVLVNGRVVLAKGKHSGELAGRALRRGRLNSD